MKDLQRYYRNSLAMVKALNLPVGNITQVTINTRAKSRWGQCTHNRLNNTYSIQISNLLLDDNISDVALIDTIIHEILHTCKDCFAHTGKWLEYANKMNSAYPNLHIKRTTSYAEKGIADTKKSISKYKITCSKCSNVWYRDKLTNIIKNPQNYHCKCGGQIKVETLF